LVQNRFCSAHSAHLSLKDSTGSIHITTVVNAPRLQSKAQLDVLSHPVEEQVSFRHLPT
jgi:hypothetical protein